MTMFMGVPTMYAYLLSAYKDMDPAQQRRAQAAVRRCTPRPCGGHHSAAPVRAKLV